MCEKPITIRPKSTATDDRFTNSNSISKSDFMIVPCGTCEVCKIKQAKVWSNRINLECKHYNNVSAYVTLTYNDKNLPKDGNLKKEHVQKFLKLLRYYLNGREIKYFAVGEYGPKNLRPHYHLIIMGVDGTDHHRQQERLKLKQPLYPVKDDWYYIFKSWKHGFSLIEAPQGGAYSYVSGYVVKNALKKKSIEQAGLEPEFKLMSKALGKRTIESYARQLKKKNHRQWPVRFIQQGKFKMAIGRYLTQVLHKVAGKLKELKLANKIYLGLQTYRYAVAGVNQMEDKWLEINAQTNYNIKYKFALAHHMR